LSESAPARRGCPCRSFCWRGCNCVQSYFVPRFARRTDRVSRPHRACDLHRNSWASRSKHLGSGTWGRWNASRDRKGSDWRCRSGSNGDDEPGGLWIYALDGHR
jgi:hypothetical protein